MASPLLDKFREQNPELAGTSDEALASFLHKTYYSDIPFSKFAQTVGVADPNEAGALRSYGLIPILKGVSDVGGAVGYGLEASGIAPEFGKDVQQSALETEQRLTERQSLQAQEDAKQRLINPDGSLGDFNFGTFAQQAGRSLPGMFVMGVPGGILAKGATTAAKALGAGTAADTIGSGIGFGAAEGVFSGATNAAQEQQTIRNTPFDKLVDSPAFLEAYHNETDLTADQNTRLEQARDIIARKAGDEVFGNTALTTGAIGALTGGGLFGQLRQGTTGGTLARAAKGFAKEAGQETPQSATEQYYQNVAEQKYLDPNIDPYRDVLTSAVEGGLVGGALGLGGVFSPSREQQETDKQIHALSDAQATQAIGAAPTVDDAIAAAGAALEPGRIVADATVPGIPLQEFLDQQIKAPDAQRIVDYSTVPGVPVQRAIDDQYRPLGYVPGEAGQVWESPNTDDADRQAQINRAFYQQEQAQRAEKEQQLREMENNPQISKQQRQAYRKARIALRVEQNRRADEFRAGLGFNVVPNRSGEVRNTQLQDQLRALQSGRPTESTGRNAERNPDPATAIGIGAGDNASLGGRANPTSGIGERDTPTALSAVTPTETQSGSVNAPTDQNIQPIAQPERGNDRTGLVADPGAAIGNDSSVPQSQQVEVLPESGSDGIGRSALTPERPAPRAYQFRGYSTGVEPSVIPDTQASAPGLAPSSITGALKIGDVVQAKPGTDAIGGTITAIREYGKKQFIETDQSGGRRFESSKFVAPTQQIVQNTQQNPEASRQALAEVRQKIQAYEAFLACLRG